MVVDICSILIMIYVMCLTLREAFILELWLPTGDNRNPGYDINTICRNSYIIAIWASFYLTQVLGTALLPNNKTKSQMNLLMIEMYQTHCYHHHPPS